MKKTIATFLLFLLTTTSLVGCGHTHTWVDATCNAPRTCTSCNKMEGEALTHVWTEASCTAPRTCTSCNKTEGEKLTHVWTDATCAAPKTCTVCSVQEGAALEHTLTEANYQTAAVCSVCGTKVGDKLVATFEEKGYSLISADTEYDYPSITQRTNIPIAGKVRISDYRVVTSEDKFAARDGYEWRIANINFSFSGDAVRRGGYKYAGNVMDYYFGINDPNSDGDKTVHYLAEKNSTADIDRMIDYRGELYECASKYTVLQNGWVDGVVQVVMQIAVQIPAGYDGVVITVYNPAMGSGFETLEALETANPQFFRMSA